MKFSGHTTDNGEEDFAELLDHVEEVDDAYVDTGWHADGEKHPDDPEYTLAEIAAVNEFGTKPGTEPKIPERSVVRSTVDAQEDVWGARSDKVLQKIQDGGDPLRLLVGFGELAASDVKRTISTIREPELAQTTKDRKGSSKPWIDTGATRAAVHSVVVVGHKTAATAKG